MDEIAFIPIDRRHLRAVSLFAATKDIRYYLNGVLVDVLPDGAVRLCATDGRAIAISHTDADDLMPPMPRRIIVPIEVVKLFVANKSETPLAISTVDGKRYKMECVGLSVNFDPVDGNFPHYEGVLPKVVSGEVAQFNPELLTRFGKADAVYAKSGGIQIEHNGDGAALVHVGDEHFLGVVMPYRVALRTGLPGWIKPGRAAPDADETDEPQTELPGVPAAEAADDKPLSTVGNADAALA